MNYMNFAKKYKLFFLISFQCYKRILHLDPINIQGLHNLCVVYVERGKLAQAQDCLQHAHQLAPNEDYILRHLKIVQQRIANLKQATGMAKQKSTAFAEYDPKDFGGSGATIDRTKNGPDLLSSKLSIDDKDAKEGTHSAADSLKKETRSQISNKHEKLHKSKQLIVDNQYQQTTTKGMFDIEQPVFLEAAKMSPKIQEEYRASNSGQNGVNRRRYQQQTHLTTPPAGMRGNSNHDQPMFVHDLDDPSSGMS